MAMTSSLIGSAGDPPQWMLGNGIDHGPMYHEDPIGQYYGNTTGTAAPRTWISDRTTTDGDCPNPYTTITPTYPSPYNPYTQPYDKAKKPFQPSPYDDVPHRPYSWPKVSPLRPYRPNPYDDMQDEPTAAERRQEEAARDEHLRRLMERIQEHQQAQRQTVVAEPEKEYKPEEVRALAETIFNSPEAQQKIVLSCIMKQEPALYKLVMKELKNMKKEQEERNNNKDRKLDMEL